MRCMEQAQAAQSSWTGGCPTWSRTISTVNGSSARGTMRPPRVTPGALVELRALNRRERRGKPSSRTAVRSLFGRSQTSRPARALTSLALGMVLAMGDLPPCVHPNRGLQEKKAAAPPTRMGRAPSLAVAGMIATGWPDSTLAVAEGSAEVRVADHPTPGVVEAAAAGPAGPMPAGVGMGAAEAADSTQASVDAPSPAASEAAERAPRQTSLLRERRAPYGHCGDGARGRERAAHPLPR